jgi:hypothetical protein
VLRALSEAQFEGSPTMVDASAAPLSSIVADPKQQAALAERIRTVRPYDRSDDPVVRFDRSEVDAARAAGCLVEHKVDHGEWESSVAFICDATLAADLAVRAVERIEREAAEVASSRASSAGQGSEGGGLADSPEDAKEARRAAREKAKAQAEAARTFNLELGRKLVIRRGAKTRREHSLTRARALAALVLADNDRLAARGLRLVLPQLQEVEVKSLKSGETREKVTYEDAAECEQYLRSRIAEAKSADEILELLADAVIAAFASDERELAQSRRVNWFPPAQAEMEKLLAAEIKAVRPRRRRASE